MYHNIGVEMKYGTPDKNNMKKVQEMSKDEIKDERDKLRKLYGDIG